MKDNGLNVNVNKLKGKLVELGKNMEDLANAVGTSESAMYRKLQNNGRKLLVSDANKIVAFLQLTAEEAVAIFFAPLVA